MSPITAKVRACPLVFGDLGATAAPWLAFTNFEQGGFPAFCVLPTVLTEDKTLEP